MFEQFVLINGIITHFSLLGAAQGIFLFFMLLRGSRADKVFSFIILFISYELALHYVYKAHMWPDYLPLFLLKDSLGYLYGYLILLYIRSLFGLNSRLRSADLVHFIPAITFFLISLFFNTPYLGYGTYSIIEFDESGITRFRFYSQNIKYLILFSYLIYSMKEVFGYRRIHKTPDRGIKSVSTTWLIVFLFAGFALWVISFISQNFYYLKSFAYLWPVFHTFSIPYLPEMLSLLNSFLMVISIYSAGYYILGKVYFSADSSGIISSSFIKANLYPAKYRKNVISESLKNEYLKRIKNCMDNEKPYLDSEFTITDFSKRIDVSTHNISRIINETFAKNFFNYVNDYRIEYAAGIISDTTKEVNILHASLDAGFNSKSVFNTAFKRRFGMTPTHYRNCFLLNSENSLSEEIKRSCNDCDAAGPEVDVAKKIQ